MYMRISKFKNENRIECENKMKQKKTIHLIRVWISPIFHSSNVIYTHKKIVLKFNYCVCVCMYSNEVDIVSYYPRLFQAIKSSNFKEKKYRTWKDGTTAVTSLSYKLSMFAF